MGSQTVTKIPSVDFSKEECFKPGTSSWLSIRKDVCHALEEFGCFVALLPNKVPLELHNTFFAALDDIFSFPAEIKMQSCCGNPSHTSYMARGGYESLGLGFATKPGEDTQKFTNHFWPDGNDSFRESTDLYAKVMIELDRVVTRMVYENYGVEKYHDNHIKKIVYNFRFNKYEEPKKTGNDLGLPGHTDKTFISVLHQNQVKGLEIKSKDNSWIGVDPSPSSFLVLAGDAFQVWSNDRVRACFHRVTPLRENHVRFSLGLFAHTKEEIEVQKELVDKDHPIKYKPFNAFEYIDYYKNNHATLGNDYSVKAYCGV